MRQLLYIDLFCGAGGTSTGVERARLHGEKCAKVIACVNHDPNAIASHAANHPNALHFTEDIRTLDLTALGEHTAAERRKNPDALLVLWASLECTNFSKAKGGQPRDADSRTLAEHLFRYIDALQPDYIYIENVEEFMCWGDLDENGKPISRDEGRLYMKWVQNVCKRGYEFDHRLLNAANYGARTSRTRFFGIFAQHGLPIVFPEPTHCKGGRAADIFHAPLKKWEPVRDVLELDNEGQSIFTRKKPLTERTLERIYVGLIKFVAGGKDAFISRYNSVRPKDTAMSLDEPCGVVTTENRFAKVKVQFLSKQFSGKPESKNVSIDEPSGAITCKDHHALATAQFLSEYYGGAEHNHSLDVPASTVTTRGRHALATAQFLSEYYGGKGKSIDTVESIIAARRFWISSDEKLDIKEITNIEGNSTFTGVPAKTTKSRFIDAYYGKGHEHSIDEPAPVVRTKAHLALVTSRFVDMQYGKSKPASIDEPAQAVTAVPKMKLVSCEKWIMNTNFNNVGSSVDEPAPVITANRKHHYLMNPVYQSKGGSIDDPSFTLVARMDKTPPYLISTEQGDVAVVIYESDSPAMQRIKEFMAIYGIVDIKMRMLNIPELKRIMGFGSDYVLVGTQTEQKKYIGNAVEVNMSRVLCEALAKRINE